MIAPGCTPDALAAFLQHVRTAYPEEAVGFILPTGYERMPNIARAPTEEFHVSAAAYVQAQQRGLLAVCHSHPDGPDYPSVPDQTAQQAMTRPWIITTVYKDRVLPPFAFGDGLPVAPLEGRVFRWGVHDCYGLVRDWFLVHRGVQLPNFPRQWQFWDQADNLFLDHLAAAGFRILGTGTPPAIGDGFLATIRGKVPNHCGVYVGRGLVLHHLPDRLSRTEPLGPWLKYVTHHLRYGG